MPAAPLLQIPELAGGDAHGGRIRIPPEIDVPVTARVRRLIDAPPFRRLAKVPQLGLVALVYPGATHSRFEHALGVYRLALLFLQRLAHDARFAVTVTPRDAERFIAAALLHDLGHGPFCHAIEDLSLPGVPRHEAIGGELLTQGELADALRQDWGIEAEELNRLIRPKSRQSAPSADAADRAVRVLASMLSGPIDIDKMDYLARDSLHAGVPYGRNFDQARLIGSLCLNAAGDGLAITDKGKTAAEMMVFSRYVMFSEVYWHHGVRAATAMVQRAFYLLYQRLGTDAVPLLHDAAATEHWLAEGLAAGTDDSPEHELISALIGPARRLYKRVAQFSVLEQREVFESLARRPYPWLVACAEQFAALASRQLGQPIAAHEILFDAPPQEREVEFRVDVYYPKEDVFRRLEDVSPVVRTLAREQFDDFVKRVRLYAPEPIAQQLRGHAALISLLMEAIQRTPAGS